MKFEHDDFSDFGDVDVTLAAACHDIGEFSALRPLGGNLISELAINFVN